MPKKAGVKMSLSEATVKFGIDPRAGQLPTHSEGKDFGKGKGKGGLREFGDSRAEENDWRPGGKGRRDRNDGSRAEDGDWFAKDGAGGGGRSSGGGFRGGGDRRQDDTEADKDRDWRGSMRDDRGGGDNRRGGGRGSGGDGPPMERKKLELKPRSKPLADGQVQARSLVADDDGDRKKNNSSGAGRSRDEADSGRPTPPWKSKQATDKAKESKEDEGDDDWSTVPTSSKKTMSTSKTSSKMGEEKSSKSLRKKKEESEEESDEEDSDSDEAPPKKSDEKKRSKEQSQKKLEQDREGKASQKEADKKLTEKEKKKQAKEQEKQESREKRDVKKSSKSDKRAKDEEEVPQDPKQAENDMLAVFEERCESLLDNDADVEEFIDEAPSLLPESSIQTVGPFSLLFDRMLRHCHGKNDEEVVALVRRLAPLLTWLIDQAKVHRFKVLVLCEIQRLTHKLGLPRLSPATALIEAVFDGLYCAEVIEEDYFQLWSINDDDTPGKTDAMFQLSAFLDWLRDAKVEGETSSEEEEDDEDRDDDEEEEEDSDIEKNVPTRPMRR